MMQTIAPNLTHLFDQLGLDSGEEAIAEFIRRHHLGHDTSLSHAHFWSPAQRQFIDESWHEDSDWCELIDQLDALLHTRH